MRDRDNITPAYKKKVRVSVLNAKFEDIKGTDAGAVWTTDALGSKLVTDAAYKHNMAQRHGSKWATRSTVDKGSANEAISQGVHVVELNSLPKAVWDRGKTVTNDDGTPLIQTTKDVAPSDFTQRLEPSMFIPSSQWAPAMKNYATFAETISPLLIKTPLKVLVINDPAVRIQGCFHKGFAGKSKNGFKREFGVMVVNLAYHDPTSSTDNYELLIHELAHNKLHNNDHLDHDFYEEGTVVGAKVVIFAVTE